MAALARNQDQGMFSGINVTPLVDIMLVLLVIFMVTARLIVSQTLPMDLPHAATGSEQQIVFAVAMNAAGGVSVDSRPVANDQDLLRLARERRANSPDLPFYSTKERGSGLGLALCREIVEAHGGTIRIENRAGGGLEVRCVLPGRERVEAPRQAKLTLSRL